MFSQVVFLFSNVGLIALNLTAMAGLVIVNFVANRRETSEVPRWAYVLFVVLLFGVALPSWGLSGLRRAGLVDDQWLLSPWRIGAACIIGLVLVAGVARKRSDIRWDHIAKLFVAMIGPSLAEALVFLGIVFGLAKTGFSEMGEAAATMLAGLLSSIAFGLYHLTHRPPWNEWPVIRRLIIVWLVVTAVFVFTGNLLAAAMFNACMATIGMIYNDVTQPAQQSWFGLAASAAVAIAVTMLLA